MKGFSVATIAVLSFCMTSHAMASESDLGSWEDFSPSGATRFCKELAVSHEEKNKDVPFVSLLLSRSSEYTEQLRELLDVSENRARLVEILISIGTKEQVVALWGDVSEVVVETPSKEWAWNLPAAAVMCSNEKVAEYIFDQGFDPNQFTIESSSFMVTAIAYRDIDMVKTLFQSGYRNCDPPLRKDASLPALAKRLEFQKYIPLHKKYCGSSNK